MSGAGEFDGQVCAVTGGAAGIGEAMCRAFAGAGARVAVLDIDLERAQSLAAALPHAHAFGCDVADTHSVGTAFAGVLAHMGRIDVLVNNAGIIGGDEYRRNLDRRVAQMQQLQATGSISQPLNATAELTDAQWRAMLSTHLDGTFHCTRAVLPGMQARRSGAIVNMSSVVGLDGGGGVPHYAAAKAGIIGFTRAVAQEVAPLGIRVNAVAPGFIDTAMRSQLPPEIAAGHVRATPLGRLGTAAEIAEAVLFLAGPRASFICGQVLSANGGYLSR
ncbi:MAG: SDR family oxidoreductase [Burkholderiales bacterium]|jgi:3-oxoacyl-[acyl-carrier protein] reductase|nr:SDR family oxidoreductase [Burkholderiales bacterium]